MTNRNPVRALRAKSRASLNKPESTQSMRFNFTENFAHRCRATAWWLGRVAVIALCLLAVVPAGWAQTSGVINYQGRVTVGGSAFSGSAQLKFALVNSNGSQIYWQNSASVLNTGEPAAAVPVTVSGGLYSVVLGDTSVANMALLPASVFANAAGQTVTNPLYLRVWFNDGVNGSQLLVPDQRLTPVAFALSATFAQTAASVPDGSITAAKLATGLLPSGITAVSGDSADAGLLGAGYQSFYSIPAAPWITGATSSQADPRSRPAGIWTGQQMMVWGGISQSGTSLGSGGLYDPLGNQWTPITASGVIGNRFGHSIVWTGQKAVVWGGVGSSGALNSGAQYDPVLHFWPTSTTSQGAPGARLDHTAVWNGQYMVVWGGQDGKGSYFNDTALYDPVADAWTTGAGASTGTPPPGAAGAKSVWTGSAVLVWGGNGAQGAAAGGMLTFGGGAPQWSAISANGAPANRFDHTAVWTGQRLLIWGGQNATGVLGDGAAYDPINNAWSPISTVNAPVACFGHTAIWTGQEMLILGGFTATGPVGTGAAYNPVSNTWRTLTTAGNPVARYGALTVWTGSQAITFGGKTLADVSIASVQILNPQPAWYFYRRP